MLFCVPLQTFEFLDEGTFPYMNIPSFMNKLFSLSYAASWLRFLVLYCSFNRFSFLCLYSDKALPTSPDLLRFSLLSSLSEWISSINSATSKDRDLLTNCFRIFLSDMNKRFLIKLN